MFLPPVGHCQEHVTPYNIVILVLLYITLHGTRLQYEFLKNTFYRLVKTVFVINFHPVQTLNGGGGGVRAR